MSIFKILFNTLLELKSKNPFSLLTVNEQPGIELVNKIKP